MKPIKILPFYLLLLASCSNDDPTIDGEPATAYSATFLDITPGNSWSSETVSYDDILNEIKSFVPYSVEEKELKESSSSIDHTETTYQLLLASSAAKMSIETVTYTTHKTTTYNATLTKYQHGRYYFPNYENVYLYLVVDVNDDSIYYGCIYKESGETAGSYKEIATLENGYYIKREKTNSTIDYTDSTTETYNGTFSVTTESSGSVTLENSEYKFRFSPSTGILTELFPRNKEIGELDKQ